LPRSRSTIAAGASGERYCQNTECITTVAVAGCDSASCAGTHSTASARSTVTGKAAAISSEHSRVSRKLERYDSLTRDYEEAKEIYELDPSMEDEIATSVGPLQAGLGRLQADALFNGEYDTGPAVVTIHSGTGGTDAQAALATRLSILNTTLRQFLTPSLFVGIGQTTYNQRTFYDAIAQTTLVRTLSQESRVTGLRIEAGMDRPVSASTSARMVIAFNPVMHGLQYSTVTTRRRNCTIVGTPGIPACPTREITDPERSAQADLSVSFTRRTHFGELVYGIRYLDYVARYSEAGTPGDGALADRNVGIMPLLGLRVRL